MATRHVRDSLTEHDFMTGLLAALVLSGIKVIAGPAQATEESIVAAFKAIEDEAGEQTEVRFWLRTNRYYGGSSLAHRMVARALRDDLLSNDFPGPNLRLKIDEDYAPRYLERLAVGQDTFMKAARAFLDEFPRACARARP